MTNEEALQSLKEKKATICLNCIHAQRVTNSFIVNCGRTNMPEWVINNCSKFELKKDTTK